MTPKSPLKLSIIFGLVALLALSIAIILSAQPLSAAAPTDAAPSQADPNGPTGGGTEPLPAGASIQTVLPGLTGGAVTMAFDPAGRLFFNEKNTGNVRLYSGGSLQVAPVFHVNTQSGGERGLLGIAIDPNFTTNRYIYIYWSCGTAGGCSPFLNKVTRFEENGGVGSNPVDIWTATDDATAGNHNGGNIHFGQDGKLYITIGDDGCCAANSQNVTVKNGKMHRINGDGTIPSDNPVFTQTGAVPGLYAIGLRNSFDFVHDPVTLMNPYPRIFASENGPGCDDEMNRIEATYNYGWRASYPCDDPNPSPIYNTISPLWFLNDAECCDAPTGITVYTGNQIPQWTNELFMASHNTATLRHFYLNPERTLVTQVNIVTGVSVKGDLETGPDGALWYFQSSPYEGSTNLNRIVGPGPTGTSTPVLPTVTSTNTPTRTPTGLIPTSTRTSTVAISTDTPIAPTETSTASPPTPTLLPTPPPCTLQFADVPEGSTFHPFIQCLACQGFISGYPCGGPGEPCNSNNDPYFRPGNLITRGQIAKIVANAAAFDDLPGDVQTFEDVPPSSTFWLFIERLSMYGVMQGYDCGGPGEPCVPPGNRPYFRPSANATRGQIAKIVSNAAGFNDEIQAGTQTFEDVQEQSTFHLFIERLLLNRPDVMSGYPCGGLGEPCVPPTNRPYFRPGATATRGQLSKIVSNTFYPDCVIPVIVKIHLFAYHPEAITVSVGTTVRFINRDLDYHTATEDLGAFNTGRLDQNQFGDVVMDTAGSYGYYCIPHQYMRGSVNVLAPGGTSR